jgi:hypothetical protein
LETVDDLADLVFKRLQKLRFSMKIGALREVLRIVYAASLIREEGRFTLGSVTFADPTSPEMFYPSLRRADYPGFHLFGQAAPFTSEAFAKLARAVERWSGSVAIWGQSSEDLHMWGIVDQLVGTNVRLHHEDESGFANPGILVINVDGPGELTAYHRSIFLGSFARQRVVRRESNGLSSEVIRARLGLPLTPTASAIAAVLKRKVPDAEAEFGAEDVFNLLVRSWTRTVSRICIGLRRAGTGGALIISASPRLDALSIGQEFSYERLANAFALSEQDDLYYNQLWTSLSDSGNEDRQKLSETFLAEADALDRQREVRNCIKLVSSLASVDGAVLLRPDLTVLGFGVKINAAQSPRRVLDGPSFLKDATSTKLIDTSRFGTRHTSMLKYCVSDPDAIGVVISQDGQVRVIANVSGDVLLWDQVKLLAHSNFTSAGAKRLSDSRSRKIEKQRLGYTDTPKTMEDLFDVLYPE